MRTRVTSLLRSAAVTLALSACMPHRTALELPGFSPAEEFGERVRVIQFDPGVTATIVAPAAVDGAERVDLILYALPNGNSTAETMGRLLSDGVSWRYDIQHIAAQTRALRARGLNQAVVVYLEADRKSWPEWRSRHGYDRANPRIVAIVDSLRRTFMDAQQLMVTLTGHSGGGSLAWGFIDGQEALPDWLDRIAFLDSNYSYEARHGRKIMEWLRRKPEHTLVSIGYDDREIMLDGKKVVSDSGGTWRASQRVIADFRGSFALTADTLGEFLRYRDAQVEILLHPNPDNRILHTEMIGEMNAYMHAMLVRKPGYSGEALRTRRAYPEWIATGMP